MNREEIEQKVRDALGVILVDKAEIHERSTLSDLFLDEEDLEELFTRLGYTFNFMFPTFIRERALDKPKDLTLPMLVDLIMLMHQEENLPEKEDRNGKRKKRKSKPTRSGAD